MRKNSFSGRVLLAAFAFAPCDVSNNSYENNRSGVFVLVLRPMMDEEKSEQFSAVHSLARDFLLKKMLLAR